MTEGPLAGIGVLVTRPEHQADGLVAAIESAGGTAFCLPAIEIVPRDVAAVEQEIAELNEPDIAIFVSPNAVRFGLAHAGSAQVAAVGPATAAAIAAAGRDVDIRPAEGFDSEHLLAEPALENVGGKTVRIVRGTSGRELLADTLRERGAIVEYLAVYERRRPVVEVDDIERAWPEGGIDAVTVMSVETLQNLVAMLPESRRRSLGETLLVTPAARVIKEALNLYPGIPTALAKSPAADDIMATIAEHAPGRPA